MGPFPPDLGVWGLAGIVLVCKGARVRQGHSRRKAWGLCPGPAPKSKAQIPVQVPYSGGAPRTSQGGAEEGEEEGGGQ